MYLISVYFDDKTNKTLSRYINAIADATGNRFMVDHNVPPHMTISSIEARSVEVLRQPFNELRGNLDAGRIQIVSIGQLLPYVFYATPVLNDYLNQLSIQVHDKMKDIPETRESRFYLPGSWMPHITLGKTLSREQMLKALQIMQEKFQPMDATVTEIGLAKVNPHEDVERFRL